MVWCGYSRPYNTKYICTFIVNILEMIVFTKFRIRIINSACSRMHARPRPRTHATGILYQNILRVQLRGRSWPRWFGQVPGKFRLGYPRSGLIKSSLVWDLDIRTRPHPTKKLFEVENRRKSPYFVHFVYFVYFQRILK